MSQKPKFIVGGGNIVNTTLREVPNLKRVFAAAKRSVSSDATKKKGITLPKLKCMEKEHDQAD